MLRMSCHWRRLLCEVHEEYRTNIRLADQGYWVYVSAVVPTPSPFPAPITPYMPLTSARTLVHRIRAALLLVLSVLEYTVTDVGQSIFVCQLSDCRIDAHSVLHLCRGAGTTSRCRCWCCTRLSSGRRGT